MARRPTQRFERNVQLFPILRNEMSKYPCNADQARSEHKIRQRTGNGHLAPFAQLRTTLNWLIGKLFPLRIREWRPFEVLIPWWKRQESLGGCAVNEGS